MPSTEKNRLLEKMSRLPAWDLIKFAALVSAAIWLLDRGTEALGYNWQWYRAWRYLVQVRGGEWTADPLMAGLWVTIKITLVSLVLAFAFGYGAAWSVLSSERQSPSMTALAAAATPTSIPEDFTRSTKSRYIPSASSGRAA